MYEIFPRPILAVWFRWEQEASIFWSVGILTRSFESRSGELPPLVWVLIRFFLASVFGGLEKVCSGFGVCCPVSISFMLWFLRASFGLFWANVFLCWALGFLSLHQGLTQCLLGILMCWYRPLWNPNCRLLWRRHFCVSVCSLAEVQRIMSASGGRGWWAGDVAGCSGIRVSRSEERRVGKEC